MASPVARFRQQFRRKWLRISIAFVSTVLIVLTFSAAGIYITLRASLPRTRGKVVLPNLDKPVTIRFDDLQRPYVQAETLDDVLLTQGWLHASHRLWQMELFRRAGSGRLAALLGEGALATDKELHRIGVPQLAKNLKKNTSIDFDHRIHSYIAGINAAINQLTVRPPEFLLLSATVEPWTSDDVYAVGALMAFQSANNTKNELLRLSISQTVNQEHFNAFLTDSSSLPDYPFVLPPSQNQRRGVLNKGTLDQPGKIRNIPTELLNRLSLLDPSQNPMMPRLALGSNGWVVSPGKSATGHALFAFDSHDDLGIPNLFYEVHLFFGDGQQIRGWSVAGLPGVINGFNQRIAWGLTNTGDTQDLFIEVSNPDDLNQFLADGEWCSARAETIVIDVAGRDLPETFMVRHTRNGPLINDSPPISLRWSAHEMHDGGLDAFFDINLSQTWSEFNAALDRIAAPTFNATYADIDGNIGFRTAGILPVRSKGEGLYPIRGDESENTWQGKVPHDQLPRSLNPPSGFIAAANARVNMEGDGPLISADNAPPYRIMRIQQVLENSDQFTLIEFQNLQTDWYDSQAAQLLPVLLDSIAVDDLSSSAVQALELLRVWRKTPDASAESPAAVIFQAWYLELAREVFEKPLGNELFRRLLTRNYMLNNALDGIIRQEEFIWWQGKKSSRLADALNRTIQAISVQLGPEDIKSWRLDRLQRVTLAHELGKAEPLLGPFFNLRSEPLGGGPATVGRANYRYDQLFRVSNGATVRFVADMKPTVEAYSVIPGGQSGHPLSEHYADQISHWIKGSYYPIQASPINVEGDVLHLTPD
ncbi:penicillin acylase family protein [bacterium]|nr:penicillin acylase family protein [bacterium]